VAALPIAALRRDLQAVSAAYRAGTLERGELGSSWFRLAIGGVNLWQHRQAIIVVFGGLTIASALALGVYLWRRR
jgi:hypothetical protein